MENNNYTGNKICPQCKKEIGYYDKLCYHCGQEFKDINKVSFVHDGETFKTVEFK